jgi:hypothetical protein
MWLTPFFTPLRMLRLHDRPADAWHALISILHARRHGDDPLLGIGQQPHNASH